MQRIALLGTIARCISIYKCGKKGTRSLCHRARKPGARSLGLVAGETNASGDPRQRDVLKKDQKKKKHKEKRAPPRNLYPRAPPSPANGEGKQQKKGGSHFSEKWLRLSEEFTAQTPTTTFKGKREIAGGLLKQEKKGGVGDERKEVRVLLWSAFSREESEATIRATAHLYGAESWVGRRRISAGCSRIKKS